MSIDRQVRLGHRQRVYVAVFVARLAGRSAVRAQPWHAVHWCVTHYRQTVCSKFFDPLSHSRHNAEDRSRKVGHEINKDKFNIRCSIYETHKNYLRATGIAVTTSLLQIGKQSRLITRLINVVICNKQQRNNIVITHLAVFGCTM